MKSVRFSDDPVKDGDVSKNYLLASKMVDAYNQHVKFIPEKLNLPQRVSTFVKPHDDTMNLRKLERAKEDHLFSLGVFGGISSTKADYHPHELPKKTYWVQQPRKWDLPMFKGGTTHQADYGPPEIDSALVETPTHPVSYYVPPKPEPEPLPVTDLTAFIKDFRRMDYSTTNQLSYTPPPKGAMVKERAVKYKRPLLKCMLEIPTYKQCSTYKLDYVYFGTDPERPEFIVKAPEWMEVNPHPPLKF